MADRRHSKQTPTEGIHVSHAYVYADAAARTAAVLTTDDVGKIARQVDTGAFYILTAAPGTWQLIGSGAGAVASVFGRTGVVTALTTDYPVATSSTPGFLAAADKLKIDLSQPLTVDTTFYVSPSGSDSNDGLTVGTPLLTIAAARAKLPKVISANVVIKLAAGTYSEFINDYREFVADPVLGKASLLFEGAFSDFTPATGLATGTFDASFGSPTIQHTASVAGAGWTVDDLKGKWVEVTSGTNLGFRFPVANNAAATLDFGMPAGTTAGSGKDLRGATFKFVDLAVTIQHPLTSTDALFNGSGTSNKPASAASTLKPVGAYGFYGIKFRATTARTLVQTFGSEARFESCHFDQADTAGTPFATSVRSARAGSRLAAAFCCFSASSVPASSAITHFDTGGQFTAGSTVTLGCIFENGSTGILVGQFAGASVQSALIQNQKTGAITNNGGTLNINGGVVMRALTFAATTYGVRLGTVPGSVLTMIPPAGAAKILGASVGISIASSLSVQQVPINNLIIDGCVTGVYMQAPSAQILMRNSSIINSTQWGVRFGKVGTAAPEPFYAGFGYPDGALTMSGNVSGDFTFDGLTAISQATVNAAPNKIVNDSTARGNYILGV